MRSYEVFNTTTGYIIAAYPTLAEAKSHAARLNKGFEFRKGFGRKRWVAGDMPHYSSAAYFGPRDGLVSVRLQEKEEIIEPKPPLPLPQLNDAMYELLKIIYDFSATTNFKNGIDAVKLPSDLKQFNLPFLVNNGLIRYKDYRGKRYWVPTPLGKQAMAKVSHDEPEPDGPYSLKTSNNIYSFKLYTLWLDETYTQPYLFKSAGADKAMQAGSDTLEGALRHQANLFEQGEIVYVLKQSFAKYTLWRNEEFTLPAYRVGDDFAIHLGTEDESEIETLALQSQISPVYIFGN